MRFRGAFVPKSKEPRRNGFPLIAEPLMRGIFEECLAVDVESLQNLFLSGEWQDISAGGVGGEVRFCDKPAAWRIKAVEEAPSGLLLDRDGSLIV